MHHIIEDVLKDRNSNFGSIQPQERKINVY